MIKERLQKWLSYRTVSKEDIKRIKKSITRRLPQLEVNYKKMGKKKVKLSLIQRLRKRLQKLYILSDDTEDGIETESDFLDSNSLSETGEEADIEDNLCPSVKPKLRRKNSSLKSYEESTDEDSKSKSFTKLRTKPPVLNKLPCYCQELIHEENTSTLRGFNQSSPFRSEAFEDKGTLADVEDCTESERSDVESIKNPQNWFLYTLWS